MTYYKLKLIRFKQSFNSNNSPSGPLLLGNVRWAEKVSVFILDLMAIILILFKRMCEKLSLRPTASIPMM